MSPPEINPSAVAPFALFDDNLTDGGDLLLYDFGWAITCNRSADVEDTFRLIEKARTDGAWIAIAANYELGFALEPRLTHLLAKKHGPLIRAWIFWRTSLQDATVTAAQLDQAIDRLGVNGSIAGVGALTPTIDQTTYTSTVKTIQDGITNGECYQINFTHKVLGELWGHPITLYRALRETQPTQYGALIRHQGSYLLSRSPELFLRRTGDTLTCKPMKGTAAPTEDLLTSIKDQAENLMIVDLIRNDLGRIVPPGSVTVDRLFEIERYPTLQQMTSTISATQATADLAEIFRALFPSGSITGAPKIRAMEWIHNLEKHPRGIYCGAIGWLAPHGACQFNVAIRTLETGDTRKTSMGLGSGITHGSNPTNEWNECKLKSAFVSNASSPIGLIETIRREPSTSNPYPFLEGHLARMRRSAKWFGLPWNESRILIALKNRAEIPTSCVMRVRLCLLPDGELDIQEYPLIELQPGQTVTLAIQRVSSQNPLLHHKITIRDVYEDELTRANSSGHFDALFLNEFGELTEGCRTNLFVKIGSTLYTPPIRSGLLPGVLRGYLLRERKATVAKVSLNALTTADQLFVGNALRGMIPVTLADFKISGYLPPLV